MRQVEQVEEKESKIAKVNNTITEISQYLSVTLSMWMDSICQSEDTD